MKLDYKIDGGVMYISGPSSELCFAFVVSPQTRGVGKIKKAVRVNIDNIINLPEDEFLDRLISSLGIIENVRTLKSQLKEVMEKMRKNGSDDKVIRTLIAKSLVSEYGNCSVI